MVHLNASVAISHKSQAHFEHEYSKDTMRTKPLLTAYSFVIGNNLNFMI